MEGPYAVTPLSHDTSTPQFRLLELHPSTQSSLIECSLRSYSFDESYPAYKALSYTWGSVKDTYQLRLNGYEFSVSRNLWTFLEQMHLQRRHGVYWIDAICINQSNTLEKNHQVQMMRRIYSTAEQVVIWLGEATQDKTSDMAMDVVASTHKWVSNRRSGDSMHESHFIWDERETRAVKHLFSRDYWTRIWIVQETVVAKDISVYCGSKSVEWKALGSVSGYVDSSLPKYLRDIAHFYGSPAVNLYSKWYLSHSHKSRIGLTQLLYDYQYFNASNILDKVYALCGIASDGGSIVIDYNISPGALVAHLLDQAPKSFSENERRDLEFSAHKALASDRRFTRFSQKDTEFGQEGTKPRRR